jgi:hypothetical protein
MRIEAPTLRRLSRGIPALLLGGALALAVSPPTVRADSSFAATSSAFGMRAVVTVPTAPVTPTPVDVGGPLAQAALDTIGNHRGLAAFPYPGDLVLTGPGLLAGLLASTPLPSLPGLPSYPFYVVADSQNAKAGNDLPFADLEATAAADAVSASVRTPGTSGDSPTAMRAVATITRPAAGAVVSSAAGSITGLVLGPLTVASVASTATITLAPDGKVSRQSSFVARGLQIGGTSVDLTPDGFSAGGSPLPVPVAKTLTDSLRQAGIDIAVLPASETPTSVVAAAVQITRHQDFGPSGNGGSVALILGQSSVSLTGAPQPAVPDGGGLLPLLTAPPAVPAPQASNGGGAADVPSTTSASPVTPLAPPAAAPAAPSAPVVTAPAASTRRPVAERIDAAPVYWLIVAVAAIAAAAGPLVRLVAARARSAS